MTRKDGVAQAEIYLDTAKSFLCYILLCSCNGFFHRQSVQAKLGLLALHGRVGDDAFFGVIAFFAYVCALYQWDNGQVEVFGKGIVATVMGRNSHDGTCSIASQHVFRNPDRDGFTSERIDGIRAREHSGYLVVAHTFQFGAFLDVIEIFFDFSFLFFGCDLLHIFRFGSQNHECNAKHCVGASGENGEADVAVFHLKLHFCSFATAYPVFLGFLYRVCPVYFVQSVKQSLRIG